MPSCFSCLSGGFHHYIIIICRYHVIHLYALILAWHSCVSNYIMLPTTYIMNAVDEDISWDPCRSEKYRVPAATNAAPMTLSRWIIWWNAKRVVNITSPTGSAPSVAVIAVRRLLRSVTNSFVAMVTTMKNRVLISTIFWFTCLRISRLSLC